MTRDLRPDAAAAMQGAGFYNRNSSLQAANLTSALPLLEDAARTLSIEGAQMLTIADYGCSQGRNSMRPMRATIDVLRERTGSTTPIQVVHTDLPSNDFASLFSILNEDAESYLVGNSAVFPSAIGRSYFEPIFPPASVDLGWSSNALHWLSRNPIDVPDHGWAIFSESGPARAAVERQLDEDWHRFLLARSAELRNGGRVVCQFLAHGPETHGFEWMAGAFWQSLAEMGQDGLISPEELLRMTCPSGGRTIEQIEAPFAYGAFAGLSLTHMSLVEAPDPYWDQFCQTGDAQALGRSWATMMRAANGPNFSAALDPGHDGEEIFDELVERLAARVASAPQRSKSYLVMLVLEEIGAA